MAKVQLQTKGVLTGKSHTVAFMGGKEWHRVWRVLVDEEPVTDWIRGDFRDASAKLVEKSNVELELLREIYEGAKAPAVRTRYAQINAKLVARGREAKYSDEYIERKIKRGDGITPEWISGAGWGLQDNTLTLYTLG